MVLTKSYLRYVDAGSFGVVGSTRANVCFVKNSTKQRNQRGTCLAAAPALENVYIWDMRTGERVRFLCLKCYLCFTMLKPYIRND